MKKIVFLVLLIVLVFYACNELEVKENDVCISTSKLIQADHYIKAGGFMSAGEDYWILKFENGLIITLDCVFQSNRPMAFYVGASYKIYQSPENQYRWKVQKEE